MKKVLITGSQGFIGSYLCTEFLSKGLAKNSSLRILSLVRNNVEDEGAGHFANALRENSSLMTLNLRNNKSVCLGQSIY